MELIKSIILKSKEKIELFKIKSKKSESKNVLIIGVFHGEEPQGYYAIKNFFDGRNFENVKNNLYIIPCLNPDGMKKNKRQNANGIDLNRNFPSQNWEKTDKNSEYYGGDAPSSEEETKFIVEIIENIKPDFILTLHSPYAVVNFDGPAKNEAKKISDIMKYPVQNDIGYPTPGSFGTYCGVERNIPTVTLELDENEKQEVINKKLSIVFEFLLEEY